jgi:hypothetical protein
VSQDDTEEATRVILRLTVTAEEAGVILREDSVTQAADESDSDLLARAAPLLEIVRGTPSRASAAVELPEAHSQDIPHLAFARDGSYDLSTPERQLAAAEAALRVIAAVPHAYHARGAEHCREEMARQATLFAQQLRRAREAPQGATAPAPRRPSAHATIEFADPPWMPEVGDECEVQLDVTGDRWWRVRYLGRGHGTSPQAIRVTRKLLDMPSLGVVMNIRRVSTAE